MKHINIIALDADEFKKSLIQEIKNELKPHKDSDELLTREETSRILKINLVTLWKWTKEGKLSSYGIGNRIYYKRSDIDQSLTQINGQ